MADEDGVKELERCVCASRFCFFSRRGDRLSADQGSHQTYQILTRATAQPIRITAGRWYRWHSLCWDGTQREIHSVIWTLRDKKKTHRESKNINQGGVEKQIFFLFLTIQLFSSLLAETEAGGRCPVRLELLLRPDTRRTVCLVQFKYDGLKGDVGAEGQN